jgi:hypothetical protein
MISEDVREDQGRLRCIVFDFAQRGRLQNIKLNIGGGLDLKSECVGLNYHTYSIKYKHNCLFIYILIRTDDLDLLNVFNLFSPSVLSFDRKIRGDHNIWGYIREYASVL